MALCTGRLIPDLRRAEAVRLDHGSFQDAVHGKDDTHSSFTVHFDRRTRSRHSFVRPNHGPGIHNGSKRPDRHGKASVTSSLGHAASIRETCTPYKSFQSVRIEYLLYFPSCHCILPNSPISPFGCPSSVDFSFYTLFSHYLYLLTP